MIGENSKSKDNEVESDLESTSIHGLSRVDKKDGRQRPRRKNKKMNSITNEYDNELNEEVEEYIETEEVENDSLRFNLNDISKGIKMLELSDEDLDRGMEIITRTKKYMNREDKKLLIKLESILDLVRGIKKLSNVDDTDDIDESDFFRTMEEDDKKNMMIKEILEVFPNNKKDSIEKAIDMKKKIELFAELFLPDDVGEGGFSLSSLANFSNLGSLGNLKLLGSLFRTDTPNKKKENKYTIYDEIVDEYEEYDDTYEEYEDFDYDEDVCDIDDDSDDDYIKIN